MDTAVDLDAVAAALDAPARARFALARRVAHAHRGLDDAGRLALVSGSTVENLCDARSDVDMSIVFAELPTEDALRAACRAAGGGEWTWRSGALAEGLVVAFELDGVEVQIGYSTHDVLRRELDTVLVAHDPDTPNHKLAEGLLKAVPLAGFDAFDAVRARVAAFPPALGRAMVRHGLATPTPWRAIGQLVHRDAALWCRELQVDACHRLLLVLAGLNGTYHTRFQHKRLHRFAARLALAPPALAARIDALLAAPPAEAFAALHALEGEVLDLVAAHCPATDLAPARRRAASWRAP